MANFTYTTEVVHVASSSWLSLETTTYRVTPRFHNTEQGTVMHDLLNMRTGLVEKFKTHRHPEHDRIGLTIDHPDLIKGNRTFTKQLMIDPEEDIPVEKIYEIFDLAMKLY